jgi:hypothetical protein
VRWWFGCRGLGIRGLGTGWLGPPCAFLGLGSLCFEDPDEWIRLRLKFDDVVQDLIEVEDGRQASIVVRMSR